MANELSAIASLSFSKGGAGVKKSMRAMLDVTGDSYAHGIQSIGSAVWETLHELSDVGTAGLILIKNLDDSNYVEYSIDNTGSNPFRINAGEFAVFRHATANLYMEADTAAVDIEYLIVEA